METFSALLAICAGNSPVASEFPTQRPVTRSFDVFVDLGRNERLSKQSWAGDLRRDRAHYDVTVMHILDKIHRQVQKSTIHGRNGASTIPWSISGERKQNIHVFYWSQNDMQYQTRVIQVWILSDRSAGRNSWSIYTLNIKMGSTKIKDSIVITIIITIIIIIIIVIVIIFVVVAVIVIIIVVTSGAVVGIISENCDNFMAADAVASCVARPSTAMAFTT